MKAIIVDSKGNQLGMSIPYNMDGLYKVGLLIPPSKFWKDRIPKDRFIKEIKIENHYIFLIV